MNNNVSVTRVRVQAVAPVTLGDGSCIVMHSAWEPQNEIKRSHYYVCFVKYLRTPVARVMDDGNRDDAAPC